MGPEPATFEAVLWTVEEPGGWTFAPVPPDAAPELFGAWGRAPVEATVDGVTWKTSVWRDRARGVQLPVPAKVRRGKTAGDVVIVSVRAL